MKESDLSFERKAYPIKFRHKLKCIFAGLFDDSARCMTAISKSNRQGRTAGIILNNYPTDTLV